MPHHSLTAHRQHHARKTSTRQIADSNSSRRSNRSQNPVRACVLSHRPTTCATWLVCVHVLVCLAAPILAEQLCAPRESEESNGRERQIAHTQITHIITHTQTQPRNGCNQPQNQKGKQNRKPKRGTTSAHTLITPVKQNTHTEG
ncbi:hypothetical protein TcCL_Unassigned02920, partial [Trypanosoma cruzi]